MCDGVSRERERRRRRNRQRESEKDRGRMRGKERFRADVAAMVTSVTHTFTHKLINNHQSQILLCLSNTVLHFDERSGLNSYRSGAV